MVQIKDESSCCGCWACVQRCPRHCITMRENEKGFHYPNVNLANCVHCGLCEKVCPVINQGEERKPLDVYAAKNLDETIRKKSSSGGIFSLLAEQTIKSGGVVFGARFNESWKVVHGYVEILEGIKFFCGSKYVQSEIGESFSQAEQFLKQGREVLFTGTPCQIAGLKLFLGKEYENLLSVDVACHGVPSPKVWKDYLRTVGDVDKLEQINFRDKSTGYKTYSVVYDFGDFVVKRRASQDVYMRGYLNNFYVRSSCFVCPAKAGKSISDITIADFWGIPVSQDDGKGTSLVLVYTERGRNVMSGDNWVKIEESYDMAVRSNMCIVKSTKKPRLYGKFWEDYHSQGVKIIEVYCDRTKDSLVVKGSRHIWRCVKSKLKL